MQRMLLATGAILLPLMCAARADDIGTYGLGEITVTAPARQGMALGGATVTQDQIRAFQRDTLDTAIQLVPGATVSAVGPRNETNVWLRGFDRWRVPLYVDGIPVYLPADNRIDFSR